MKNLIRAFVVACLCMGTLQGWGQQNMVSGATYTENFAGMTTTALPTNQMTGWAFAADNSTARQINTGYSSALTSVTNTLPTASCASSGGSYKCKDVTAGTGGTDYCPGVLFSGSLRTGTCISL